MYGLLLSILRGYPHTLIYIGGLWRWGVRSMGSIPPEVQREFSNFMERTKRSSDIFKDVRDLVPAGVSSNYRALEPYPLYFSRGYGSKLVDADGNVYIDYNLAFGVLVAGHNHPRLVEMVEERVRNGVILGFEYERIYELAAILSRRFKLDMVRFSSTGLEATLHAIRIARGYTQRRLVVKFLGNYHGSHDFFLVATKPNIYAAGHRKRPAKVPSGPGVSQGALSEVLVAQYGDLESVEMLFKEYPDEIAAVILEPVAMNMGVVIPSKEFMHGLRRLCDEYGVVLIFDEVKTCGKLYGGAEEFFGVKPDMKTLAKAIAGGFPLSVIGGKKEIMSEVGPGKIPHAGTFNSNPLSIDAGIVTLEEILTRDAMDRAIRYSEELMRAHLDIFNDAGVPVRGSVFGTSGAVMFSDRDIVTWHDFLEYQHTGRWWVYFVSMMNRGVIPTAPGPDEQWTVSVQHTEEDIQKTVDKLNEVASLVAMEVPKLKNIEAF